MTKRVAMDVARAPAPAEGVAGRDEASFVPYSAGVWRA